MKLSQLVNHYNAVPEDTGFLVHCPAHSDTHRSLRIDVNEQGKLLVTCRAGCAGLDVIKALPSWVRLEGVEMDVDSAKAATAERVPVGPAEQAAMASYLFRAEQAALESSDAEEYARDRFGVSHAQFLEFGLGYDPGSGLGYGGVGPVYCEAPRLVVPFRDANGIPRGFQSRALHDEVKARWAGPKNVDGGTWARSAHFNGGMGADWVVVCEGPGDALAVAASSGFDSVGIRGVGNAQGMVDELVEAYTGRRLLIAGDNDRAGHNMNVVLAKALSGAGLSVYLVQLPEQYGDISDWYSGTGESFASEFQTAVAQATLHTSDSPVSTPEPEPEGPSYDDLVTHVGIAREVKDIFKGHVKHVEGLGFFLYEGGLWKEDPHSHTIRTAIHSISDRFEGEAKSIADDQDPRKAALFQASVRLRTSTFIDHVVKELKALVPASVEDFDQSLHLLSFKNGVVDLRSGELIPHAPEFLLSHQLDINYDPQAKAPRWESFIQEIQPGRPDVAAYLQRVMGYGITGETSEQCFAVFYGTGANGKSILTDTLLHIFADISLVTPFSTFEAKRDSGGPSPELAALRGARLVVASEGDRGKPMDEAVLKSLTGQDMVTARHLFKGHVSFKPQFLLLLASNYKPGFKGQDEGLWRRIKLIPFKRFFSEAERDHDLGQKLLAEAEGIAAWCVAGAVEWYRAGLQDPDSIKAATQSYRDTADALGGFFPDGPLERGEDEDRLLVSEVYKLYQHWADEEELSQKEIWSRSALMRGLEERGCERKRFTSGMHVLGIKKAPKNVTPPFVSVASNSTRETIFDKGETQ